jgi:GntR family transcriptional regulator, transcriptional repressor for pyruvate dehydrogenase complex
VLWPAGRTRADTLVAYVEQLIEQRGLGPGDRIATKEDLREQTTAARATINEAVRLLQNRGRVTIRPGPGGGLFVAPTSPLVRFGQTLLAVSGDAHVVPVADAIAVRDALEPLVAREAAQHHKPVDVFELQALLQDMASAVVDDAPRFLRANWALHTRIGEIVHNGVLRAMYLALTRYIEEQSTAAGMPLPVPAHLQHMLGLHTGMIDAIVRGQAEEAASLAEQHASSLRELRSTPANERLS